MSDYLARADAARLPLPDRAVALTIGSPPYCDARTYGIGAQRDAREWVDWMLRVTAECLRVTDGPVIWVCAGVTRDRTYWPACEGLAWRWFAEGWGERGRGTERNGSAYRPCYWHRSGIPGNGGDQWYRADVEYCLAFKRPGPLPYAAPTVNGHKPVCGPGGKPSYRQRNGKRVTGKGQWKRGRRSSGKVVGEESSWTSNGVAILPEIANPGNLIDTGAAGGGHLGHEIAHESEAPFPTEIPAFFIASHCPHGGVVLDPFAGSGTTGQAAMEAGRRFIGFDLRQSQCVLSRRRLRTVTPALAGMEF